jgi:hypothetical protein
VTTLSDDDLVRLLSETAATFPVPEPPAALRAAVREDVERTRTPLHLRPAVRWLVAASVVLGLGTLAVSSVDVTGTSGDDSSEASPAAANQADRLTAGSTGGSTGSTGGSAGSTGGSTASTGSSTAFVGGVDVSQGVTPRVAAPAPDQGRVVKSGDIALEVADGKVSSTLTDIQRVATGQGGLVFGSTTRESGPRPSGEITVRVPVEKFEATVVAVRELDAEVVSASTKAADVTAQYADLQTQVRTLKATRERYLVILGQADTVGEVLSVQQRVDGVSGQIDQLEGRLKVLGAQSDLSTLKVSVTEKGDPSATTPKEKQGLSKAWDDAVDNFAGGVEAIVRASGGILVVGLSLIVLWLVGSLGYRVVRRRMV